MLMTGPARIGNDARLDESPNGTPVAEFPIAYDYGRLNNDGERPTQWVVASLWGSRAKSVGQYLKKGRLIDITLKDVHVEIYETSNGTRYKLKGRVVDFEFIPVGAGRQDQRQAGSHHERDASGRNHNGQAGPEPSPSETPLEDYGPFNPQ